MRVGKPQCFSDHSRPKERGCNDRHGRGNSDSAERPSHRSSQRRRSHHGAEVRGDFRGGRCGNERPRSGDGRCGTPTPPVCTENNQSYIDSVFNSSNECRPSCYSGSQYSNSSNQTTYGCGGGSWQPDPCPNPGVEEIRSFNGVGNNQSNPDLGAANTEFTRIAPQDASRSPENNNLPSPREISNIVLADDGLDSLDPDGASDLLWQWGQFIDHDMTFTPENQNEHANINIPTGDPLFDPQGTGLAQLEFARSEGSLDENGQRQQTNALTAFLDGSQVYGNNQEVADQLRSFEGGKLRTSDNNQLPVDADTGNFLAGDGRVNEQPGLTSMHTLFMREHNRLADQYAAQNPNWSDEQIYQAARAKNIAFMQSITYNEFLPTLLGENALQSYEGYDPSVDPSISNEFATAAFRFGHSMVSPIIPRVGPDGQTIPDGNLNLAHSFNNPDIVKDGGIDDILRGQAGNIAQQLDNEIIGALRNQLFGVPGSGASGLDLGALNIQRGRDHELASYNDTREALGMCRIECWNDPIFRDGLGEKLSEVYDHPDDIDLWVGGLAEQNVNGSKMGQLFTRINAQQFENLRDGDRFFYANVYSGQELAEINSTTLSDIIRRNTTVTNIQDNAFVVDPSFPT